jgi:hypothetical protein
VVGQIGLFSRAQIAGMRDRTKRRNYSEEAEEFRRDHARRRRYGLAQRHAQKLTRLYGSPARAEAEVRREFEEASAARSRAREAAQALPDSPRPEALAAATDRPASVRLKSIRSEPVRARREVNGCAQVRITQAEPQTSGPAQPESTQAEPQAKGLTQPESTQTEPQAKGLTQPESTQTEPQAKGLTQPESTQARPEIGECAQAGSAADESAQDGPKQDGPEASACEQAGSQQAKPEAGGSMQVESAQVSPQRVQGKQIDPESGGPGPGERVPIGPERVDNLAGVIDSSGQGRILSGSAGHRPQRRPCPRRPERHPGHLERPGKRRDAARRGLHRSRPTQHAGPGNGAELSDSRVRRHSGGIEAEGAFRRRGKPPATFLGRMRSSGPKSLRPHIPP